MYEYNKLKMFSISSSSWYHLKYDIKTVINLWFLVELLLSIHISGQPVSKSEFIINIKVI